MRDEMQTRNSLSYPIENAPVFKRDHDDHVEGDNHNDHNDTHAKGTSAASSTIEWSLMAVAATFLATLIGF
ncbi:5161_t:CDS:2 [Funneliformis caledonium]|uniref:5161_t:CDS:1 n=2 Tax=Funneliformis TaxID=1117308 RepID=A0A9N9D313_9GLOM|nr:14747_t:CDS:2 [Funneliformis mosseae]CAG8624357.1 5161_t:CDS:2 [Funneliformis caledonium]